jgi:alkylhydroperoxidase family enzyme
LVRKGFSEEDVNKLHDYENSNFPERTKMALRLTDKLAGDHRSIDPEFYRRLREHFDDAEILDLGMGLTFALGWQRFIEAFGVRPDNWSETMPMPWDPREKSPMD